MTTFITRNGKLAYIDGMSDYMIFGQRVVLLTGIVDDELVQWNGNRYATNLILGLREKHGLDLVDWIRE